MAILSRREWCWKEKSYENCVWVGGRTEYERLLFIYVLILKSWKTSSCTKKVDQRADLELSCLCHVFHGGKILYCCRKPYFYWFYAFIFIWISVVNITSKRIYCSSPNFVFFSFYYEFVVSTETTAKLQCPQSPCRELDPILLEHNLFIFKHT